MADNAGRDQNDVPSLLGVSNVDGKSTVKIYADPVTHRLLVDSGGSGTALTVTDGVTTVTNVSEIDFTSGVVVTDGGGGTADVAVSGSGGGTVTSVSVATANGVSGTVANPTTTPAITLALGAITPSSVNSVVVSGSSTPTLAVTGTSSISGSNTGDQNLFSSVPVSGQTTVTANSTTTALTLVAGSNMTITTDNTAKSVTFASSGSGGGGSNAFAWFIS